MKHEADITVVLDRSGSMASITEWAQRRNVEAGVLVRNRDFARQLRQQFDG